MPGAADPLEPAGHRLRRLDLNDEVDRAHVDAELERGGGDQAWELTGLQELLDDEALFVGEGAVVGSGDLDRGPCGFGRGFCTLSSLMTWIFSGGVSEWPMVSDSKSDVRKHRGFKSLPLRHVHVTRARSRSGPPPWRGDRVAEGARLEIVCTERYRGFESLSLRRQATA